MIVVDTNIIAYFYLPGPLTVLAEQLYAKDSDWAAPVLWRSELRNTLTLYFRKKLLSLDAAYSIQTEAEAIMAPGEHEIDSQTVLRLAHVSRCTAYDCEFIALGEHLDVPVVTVDKKLLQAFPAIAVSLESAIKI